MKRKMLSWDWIDSKSNILLARKSVVGMHRSGYLGRGLTSDEVSPRIRGLVCHLLSLCIYGNGTLPGYPPGFDYT